MTDISFLQCQSTRTRLATDQSVDATATALKDAFERCDDVKAWNEGQYDFYVESEAGRQDEGYRANVDVYEREGRTHVLVDCSPLMFHGSAYDDRRKPPGWDINVRHDHFHDVMMTAIVASLTDTPEGRIATDAWDPRSDVGIEEHTSTQQTQHSDSSPTDASADEPSDEQRDTPSYVKEVPDREQEPYDPDHSGTATGIAIGGLGVVAFISLPIAFAISFVLGFLAAIAGAFLVLVVVAIYQENVE